MPGIKARASPFWRRGTFPITATESFWQKPACPRSLSWRPFAVTSAASDSRLGFRERSLAHALADLASDNAFHSCAEYRRLLARDSLDFVAWFGLGECQTKDRLVVRDPQSASGWRFRSSYRAAASAYQRALELIPSVHRAFTGVAFTRLTSLFHTEAGVYRRGYALASFYSADVDPDRREASTGVYEWLAHGDAGPYHIRGPRRMMYGLGGP